MAVPPRPDLPSGTVTFLFTDVEGSTKLVHELGAEGYAEALAEHRRLIREACAAEGGVEVDTQGDAFFFAFPTAPGALAAASAFTDALASGPIQVRVGLHTGTPHLGAEGYVGGDVHRAARIAAAGHGGQVLVSAATAQLVDAELVDLGARRLKDLSTPERVYQLGDAEFPPLKCLERTNFPVPATPLVGREQELAAVAALLTKARLITLTGPGGTGKTRLALHAAAAAAEDHPDGVFWVPLAGLRDPELVLPAAAQALEATGDVQSYVADKALLLLLDNFEHVVEAAPALPLLLSACPNLKLVVTIREVLRVTGESEYPVPPLAEHEAVELFRERSGFEPDDTVAELCRRLDSLPLAVELAAARTRALTPGQILERLSQRLDLLKGGRDSEARQETLRATIEWSYELLSPDEQQLFARLAIFAGGCTLEAVEEVAGAEVDALQSLVEKSLVRFTDARYSMLETIQEFAVERLDASADLDQMRQRHAEHFLSFAEAVGGVHLYEGAQPAAVARLAREQENFRAAIQWALERQRFSTVLRFGDALWMFWHLRGHAAEARRWLDPAVAAGDRNADEWVAGALALGELDRSSGDVERARALKQELVPILRERRDVRPLAGTLADLGDIAMDEGEYELAHELLEESLELRGDPSAAPGTHRTLASLGELALLEGDLCRAEELYERAHAAAAERDPYAAHTAWCLLGLAEARRRRADLTGAERASCDALRILYGLENTVGVANCLEVLAAVAAAQGRDDRAERLGREADALRRDEPGMIDETVKYALSAID